MPKQLVAASSPEQLVVRDGEALAFRTPYGPDQPLGDDQPVPGNAEASVLALVTKGDFLRVVGEDGRPDPRVTDVEYPAVKRVKAEDGDGEVFKVVDRLKGPKWWAE